MSYIGQQLPADVFSGYVTDSFTGDGSATTFTLSKVPFSEDTLIVVINNVIQKPTTNFTVSGTTLTIVGTAVASGDVIYAIHTGGVLPITTASKLDATTACTITTSDNTDTLSLISTDTDANAGPNLRLYRNSSSPADSDYNGAIQWEWRNDNSQDVVGAEIQSFTRDASDGTEDNILWFQNMTGGTLTEFLRFDTQSDQALITFNENSNDIDFRVESDGKTHAFFVQASDSFIGMGTSTPQDELHVYDTGSVAIRASGGDNNNKKAQMGYDNSAGPYIKGGSSGIATFKILVDNTTLAMTVAQNGVISGDFNDTSDVALKENIVDLESATEKLKQLKARTFDWKKQDKGKEVAGFIAQEVESVIPSAVVGDDYVETTYYTESDDLPENTKVGDAKVSGNSGKAVNTSAILAYAVKTIQELEARIKALEDA